MASAPSQGNRNSLSCWRTRPARASRCPGSESAKDVKAARRFAELQRRAPIRAQRASSPLGPQPALLLLCSQTHPAQLDLLVLQALQTNTEPAQLLRTASAPPGPGEVDAAGVVAGSSRPQCQGHPWLLLARYFLNSMLLVVFSISIFKDGAVLSITDTSNPDIVGSCL